MKFLLFIKNQLFYVLIVLLSLNSIIIWVNYYKKSIIDEDTNLWFKSKFETINNDRNKVKEIFEEKIYTKIKNIYTEITTPRNPIEGLIVDYGTKIDFGKTKLEDFAYKNGIFYLNSKKTVKGIEKDSIIKYETYKKNQKGDNTATMYTLFINELTKMGGNINSDNFSDLALTFFDAKQLRNYIPGLKINRIYLASSDGSVVIYPYTTESFGPGFVPLDRFWWKSGFLGKPTSEFKNNDAGLTSIYPDIDSYANVNLTRSYWYRFPNNESDFLICFDFWVDNAVNPNAIKIGNFPISIPYLLFAIELFLLVALYIVYKRKQEEVSKYLAYSDTYRLKRENIMYVSDTSQENLEIVLKTAEQESKWRKFNFGGGWIYAGAKTEFIIGKDSQKLKGTEVKLTKRFDLSLTNAFSTKAVELWSVEKSNMPEVVGLFEIVWSQNDHIDLKISEIYWNTDLEKAVVRNELKNKILKNEITEFPFNPLTEPEPLDLALETLKSIPQISLFSQKVDSFSKRKFDFDFDNENILEFIKKLYEIGETKAVCSVEFLRKLIEINKFQEILSIGVKQRIVIETPDKELRSFIDKEVSEDQRNFLSNTKFDYKIITSNSHIAYRNRDFVIIETNQNIKFVLVTNISDGKVSSGWISWRLVDIHYYSEILNSLNSFRGGKIKDFIKMPNPSLN
ncbi:hypothetical protein [Emticicia sp. BO119]|uniref:hypothetical protein n=1 Tax=Emticicia sp. BO119 TaxID=2757768 RepID=UPI0015F10109|nr:hypothetical protein [Emticicia sp. BO119]MBA4851224.1 hypothetical protein [Emticicia sp. BO119]